MCDSRVEYDSEALYLNSLPSKISADVPPQYNLNCIFLLDHNRKLPPDDSEPFARQSSISFVERANSGFIMRRGLVTGFIAVACSAMVAGWMSWKQGRGSGFIFAVQGLSMAPTLLGEHRIVTCRVCDVRWPVGLADDPELLHQLPSSVFIVVDLLISLKIRGLQVSSLFTGMTATSLQWKAIRRW